MDQFKNERLLKYFDNSRKFQKNLFNFFVVQKCNFKTNYKH